MTRDEYLKVLATERATPDQRGAVMREFSRLGFGENDRAERLAVCALLLGLSEVDSTRDLTMGQAGYLVRLLGACTSRAALPMTGTGNIPRNSAFSGSSRWPAVITELAVALYRSRSVVMAPL
jgi:hypothetical protein